MDNKTVRISENIYAFLLKLYPKNYRQEFGKEMQYVFSEQLSETHQESGGSGVFKLWGRTLLDAGKSLVIQHIESEKGKNNMKTNNTTATVQNSVLRVAFVTAIILFIPFVMSQLRAEWKWDVSDFIIIGVLISTTGLIIELLRHKVRNNTQRLALVIVVVLTCLYIWAELAVGIFTNLGS